MAKKWLPHFAGQLILRFSDALCGCMDSTVECIRILMANKKFIYAALAENLHAKSRTHSQTHTEAKVKTLPAGEYI